MFVCREEIMQKGEGRPPYTGTYRSSMRVPNCWL